MGSKSLIVVEKPSVGMDFARLLKATEKHDGYMENEKWIVTWCVGHLVTMSYPERYDPALKMWSLNDLPFLPDQYRYEVIDGVKKQFGIVKKLLNRSDIDVIYNAGDSGREGEYIQRLVYNMAGWNKSAKMLRIWIDSQTDEELARGIKEAKPASEYNNLAAAAYARGIEDYAMGINFSRALTCKFGYEFNKKIKSKERKSISVGRVMTCVLGMIVDRENEIRDFKPTSYYGIEADTGFTSKWKAVEGSKFFNHSKLYNETGFCRKEDAEKLLEIFNKKQCLKVEKVERKQEKKSAPLLFNLAELQNECSKRFKISPDKTLEVAQKLYEAKLTTYPRTDARVISTAVAKEIHKNISGLVAYDHGSAFAAKIMQNEWYRGIGETKYTDDKKITDHYAIIPTGFTNVSSLSDLEIEVFHMIIDRFLSIFYPPAIYQKVEVVLRHPTKEHFYTSEKILKEQGYLEVIGTDTSKPSSLIGLQEESVIKAEFYIKEGQTQPPKRYNSGSIILAMENAGNLIEDEELRAQIKGSGIGTSATRAEVLKKLKKIGYIIVNEKTQIITPHPDGEVIYTIVKDHVKDMLSPRMTASWEKGLSQIENGEITQEKYIGILNDYVKKHVEAIKGAKAEQGSEQPRKEYEIEETNFKCPKCGKMLHKSGARLYCDCKKFTFWTEVGSEGHKKALDEGQIQMLLDGLTIEVKDLISKKGTKFSCNMQMEKSGKLKMIFPDKKS